MTGSLQVEETSAYCTGNHRALASNYQLSKMKRPVRDSNQWNQRLESRRHRQNKEEFTENNDKFAIPPDSLANIPTVGPGQKDLKCKTVFICGI